MENNLKRGNILFRSVPSTILMLFINVNSVRRALNKFTIKFLLFLKRNRPKNHAAVVLLEDISSFQQNNSI